MKHNEGVLPIGAFLGALLVCALVIIALIRDEQSGSRLGYILLTIAALIAVISLLMLGMAFIVTPYGG